MRPATGSDVPAISAFLHARIETSMFLAGNLEAHGITGSAHRHATRFWIMTKGGSISGVFGRTHAGLLLVQIPGMGAAAARVCLACIAGQSVLGMTGEAGQIRALERALVPDRRAWRTRSDQPLLRRDLGDLNDRSATIRSATAEDEPMLRAWLARYLVETGTEPAERAEDAAREVAERATGDADLHLLIEGGRPVAMAQIIARAGRAVQVGGVFVPPDLRGQGRAGRVVGAVLGDAAARGAETAVLFAARPAAVRSYLRIGFVPAGFYRIALLHSPVVTAPAA